MTFLLFISFLCGLSIFRYCAEHFVKFVRILIYQGLQIGDKVHKFSAIAPETQSSPLEIYRQKTSSLNPKLDLLGRVTHKIQVRRGLDKGSMDRIKNRTEEAERERHSRKFDLRLEK